jgi:hypothetical protein
MVAENQGLEQDEVVKTPEEIKRLADDPVKKQMDQLAMNRATLENEEISAKIDKEQSEVSRNQAAIENDEELMRLKAIELQGKEIEAAALLRLKEKEIDANIAIKSAESKKTAGEKKTTVGATNKTSKNDGAKTNNKKG